MLSTSGRPWAVLPAAPAVHRSSFSCAPHKRVLGRALVPRAAADDQDYESIRAAASFIADTYVTNGQTVGVGTGVAVNCFLHELSERLSDGRLQGVSCIASSDASASEAAFHGVPQAKLEEAGCVDFLLDVASELDVGPAGGLAYVVGRGASGEQVALPCLQRLRALLGASSTVCVVAEREAACSARLGGSLPVLVEGAEWEETAEELDDLFLGDAEVWRRATRADAGPRGGDSALITADGHMVLDIRFDELKLFGKAVPYEAIAAAIEEVPGVVTHGLVVGAADVAVVASSDAAQPIVVQRSDCMVDAE